MWQHRRDLDNGMIVAAPPTSIKSASHMGVRVTRIFRYSLTPSNNKIYSDWSEKQKAIDMISSVQKATEEILVEWGTPLELGGVGGAARALRQSVSPGGGTSVSGRAAGPGAPGEPEGPEVDQRWTRGGPEVNTTAIDIDRYSAEWGALLELGGVGAAAPVRRGAQCREMPVFWTKINNFRSVHDRDMKQNGFSSLY
ncbi:uncharacterized protein LOC143216299 [Lasioglossum baleicum]|uniref:uncharacterized protein LOC143216299 n=1 Tax=Lasioglossum baleicum TaxID=434251 RepID=UPI003FCC482C